MTKKEKQVSNITCKSQTSVPLTGGGSGHVNYTELTEPPFLVKHLRSEQRLCFNQSWAENDPRKNEGMSPRTISK